MHSSSSVRNRKRYRGVACRTHSERYRAIVHDSMSGCQHFRTSLSGSVSGSGLKSDIPTLSDVRSPGTIIGVNSGSDHVVSSKRFLPERLINRERGNEGRQSERDKDKVCPYRKTRSIAGGITSRPGFFFFFFFFRWNNRVPVITLF